MCWIYIMKEKSEVAEVFMKFKRRVENHSSCKIQMKSPSNKGNEFSKPN